jgi:hypothetical protein
VAEDHEHLRGVVFPDHRGAHVNDVKPVIVAYLNVEWVPVSVAVRQGNE